MILVWRKTPSLLVASACCAFAASTSLCQPSGQAHAAPQISGPGSDQLQQKHYREAMDAFESTLKSDPRNLAARQGETAAANAWALENIRQGHPEQAMEVLERGIQQLPDEPDLLLNFGIEATVIKQYSIAEQALAAASRLRPNDAKTVYAQARLEVEEQHFPEAIRDLKAYTALRPDDASAYFGLGHVYAMQQQYPEAREAFQQSLKLKPQQTESYYQLGQLALQAHEDKDAQENFSKVLERFPTHAGALTGLGEIALRAKEYAKAEQLLAAAERSDPNYQTPHYFRGLALAKLGRKEEAEQEMKLGDSRPHATGPAQNGSEQRSPSGQPPG